MILYCCGLYFSEDFSKVLLIKKNRPEFLKGRLNGIGGKLERQESYLEAMTREFKEECGIDCNVWHELGDLSDKETFSVKYFYSTGDVSKAITVTDEEIVTIETNNLPESIDVDTYKIIVKILEAIKDNE